MKLQCLVATTVLVAGCANVPEYTAPPGAPRGQLTLDRGEVKAAAVWFWTEGSNCTAPQILGKAFWDGNPVEIQAGKEIAIGMATVLDTGIGPGPTRGTVTLSSTTCGTQVISFTPSANTAYTVRYLTDSAAKTCQMTLVRTSGGKQDPEPTARRRAPTNERDTGKPGCT